MKKIKEIKSDLKLKIAKLEIDGGYGESLLKTANGGYKLATVVFSWGLNWEHVSVSFKNRVPTWDEMCQIKDIFWGEDETVVQYHPAKQDYVNRHPYCLHLWKPIDQELPKPPKILV